MVLTVSLYEDQGIANVHYAAVYLDFGGLEFDEESITSIIYSKNSVLQINDPNSFFSDAGLTILERDAYNGVLQLKMKFQKPMDTSSIQIVTWDFEKNKSVKTFEDIIRIEDPTQSNKEIPNWIKSSASWWSNDQISDEDFLQGIEFLVKENIILVKDVQPTESSQEIPSWIKNNAAWWADDLLSDGEFVTGIEYLIKTGILSIHN